MPFHLSVTPGLAQGGSHGPTAAQRLAEVIIDLGRRCGEPTASGGLGVGFKGTEPGDRARVLSPTYFSETKEQQKRNTQHSCVVKHCRAP